MAGRDWVAWHEPYRDPDSSLARRLRVVQRLLSEAIDETAPGRIRLVSACAGQGDDLLGVLPDHGRRDDLSAVLVEWDERNAEVAAERAAGFDGVEVRRADAGRIGSYAGGLPADIVLLCGVFGNISDHDVEQTIERLPELCAPEGTVIWTRHRRDPDLTPTIRRWFAERDFDEVEIVQPDHSAFCVGAHRFRGSSRAAGPEPLFRFVGYDELLG